MKMPSVMSHQFSQIPAVQTPRSQFNRSHGYKTTLDAGYIVPIFVDEALPGDTFNLRASIFARLATPQTPVMDNMFADLHFFAVPMRLVWENWERFNGAQDDPGDSTDFEIPTMTSTAGTGYAVGSLHDYFGLPTGIPGLVHSSLWHRAYNLIYNEWYRDQNLQNSVVVDTDDGPDTVTDYVLLRRGKRHDYFTSALPWPQKGPSVALPLGSTAPVIPDGNRPTFQSVGGGEDRGLIFGAGTPNVQYAGAIIGSGSTPMYFQDSGLMADLSAATAATINQIREAFQVQKLYERDARGGTRYVEILLSHFGVVSPDFRLQRPEFLGGGTKAISLHPVAQTSSTDATTPQGNLSAFGTLGMSGIGFTKSFVEHSLVLGFISVRADLTYQQGLNRMFSRSTRFDFYWPTLAHLGEQAILNKEIYAQGTANPTEDAAVFGYQERYAEYRYKPSQITGQFRSTFAQSLDNWHLSQEFGSLPALNSTFIVEDPPIDRVIAVPAEPHFLLDAYFDFKCARPMPVYSVPGLIDHF